MSVHRLKVQLWNLRGISKSFLVALAIFLSTILCSCSLYARRLSTNDGLRENVPYKALYTMAQIASI